MSRTFSSVISSDPRKGRMVVLEIAIKGSVSPSAVYAWARKERKPMPLYQKLVQRTIRRHFGITIPLEELFS